MRRADKTIEEASRPARAWRISKAAGLAVGIAVSAALIMGASSPRLVSARQASSPKTSGEQGNAQNGRKLFVKYGCYECHGYEGQGSIATAPRVGPDPLPLEA